MKEHLNKQDIEELRVEAEEGIIVGLAEKIRDIEQIRKELRYGPNTVLYTTKDYQILWDRYGALYMSMAVLYNQKYISDN